jgi:hypothetical protein
VFIASHEVMIRVKSCGSTISRCRIQEERQERHKLKGQLGVSSIADLPVAKERVKSELSLEQKVPLNIALGMCS